jgi:uncharacterized protein (DUF2235 family)
MRRCLILCIDGTWNAAREGEPGDTQRTNVARIYDLLVNDGERQSVKYIPGIGTEGLLDRMSGGVWGGGSTNRIQVGYDFLCRNYRPGDRIGLFGFSRGAFAVRAIVGMIANFGIMDVQRQDKIKDAIRLYRKPRSRWTGQDEDLRRQYQGQHYDIRRISFVGVWDTVIRYGPILAPLHYLFGAALARTFGLLDRRVPECVETVAHALALDECRAAFFPWRFEKRGDLERRGQIIEELWFPGSHSDVGGGNRDGRLAEIPFVWMCRHANNAGIAFNSIPTPADDAFLAPIEDSHQGFWRMFPPRVRTVEPHADFMNRCIAVPKNAATRRRQPSRAKCNFTALATADTTAGTIWPRSKQNLHNGSICN